MKKKQTRDKRLSLAKKMPPLYRKRPGEKYSAQNDEVLDWVKFHTDLVMYLIDVLRSIGYIVYNEETGEWKGVDYEV